MGSRATKPLALQFRFCKTFVFSMRRRWTGTLFSIFPLHNSIPIWNWPASDTFFLITKVVALITEQDTYEEVDLISKGGNYGWRSYEGPYPFSPPQSPARNTSLSSISPIFPVMGYNHSDVNSNEGSASITGGYFYRSMTDPCMHGR